MGRSRLSSLEPVRTYVREHLVQCVEELLRWKTSGVPHGPTLLEAARLVQQAMPDTSHSMRVAVNIVESASLEAAVELMAWRSHFPMHFYRTDDSSVSLRAR